MGGWTNILELATPIPIVWNLYALINPIARTEQVLLHCNKVEAFFVWIILSDDIESGGCGYKLDDLQRQSF